MKERNQYYLTNGRIDNPPDIQLPSSLRVLRGTTWYLKFVKHLIEGIIYLYSRICQIFLVCFINSLSKAPTLVNIAHFQQRSQFEGLVGQGE